MLDWVLLSHANMLENMRDCKRKEGKRKSLQSEERRSSSSVRNKLLQHCKGHISPVVMFFGELDGFFQVVGGTEWLERERED